jgi:type II secretory pathway pseudopilin PulG
MLVVMAIIGLVVGISLTGLNFSTPRRQAAVSNLKGVLDQTRAHALESGKYTALMVVDGLNDGGLDTANLRKYAVFEVGELGTSGEWVAVEPARQVTSWQSLPDGVAFLKDLPGFPTVLDTTLVSNPDLMKIRTLKSANGTGAYPEADLTFSNDGRKRLPGVVFSPKGSVASPRLVGSGQLLCLRVVEGTVETADGSSTVRPTHDPALAEGVVISRLTGTTRYLDPIKGGDPAAVQ